MMQHDMQVTRSLLTVIHFDLCILESQNLMFCDCDYHNTWVTVSMTEAQVLLVE